MKRFAIILAAAAALAGCNVYREYSRPADIDTDNLFGEGVETPDGSTIADMGWRDFFTDVHLQRLIEQGLANNCDMKIAAQRITEAEAALRTARLSYYPSFAFAPSVATNNYVNHTANQNYQLPITASWEVDIAGRLWNGKRRARAAYEQSKIYRKSVQTQVVASIANCYYTLLMLDAQLSVSRMTATMWKENVRTIKAMKRGGMTNEAAVAQTEANSWSIDASLFDLEYDIVQVENTLALLLGTTPQHFERGTLQEQTLCERLLVGVPAQLLSRRPDVLSAEYTLQQMFYNVNLAHAAFYPSLTLSGSGGWINQFGATITSPGSLLFSFVGKLLEPIFDAGRNRANLKIAEAQMEQAAVSFRQTLLQAGSEVNSALAQCQTSNSKTDIRKYQIEALQNAVKSTEQLMRHSDDVSYLEVLTAQQTLLSARLSQIADRFEGIQGIINLYRALGGGADEPAAETEDETAAESVSARRVKPAKAAVKTHTRRHKSVDGQAAAE